MTTKLYLRIGARVKRLRIIPVDGDLFYARWGRGEPFCFSARPDSTISELTALAALRLKEEA